VGSFTSWLYGFAQGLGASGLFVVAFLDSSFISLPLANDALVVYFVTANERLVLLFVAMATAGSVAGCYTIYYLAKRGGEAFLRKRLRPGHVERALAAYRRHGLLALVVPALLPPPAPFKLFVLAAGIADVRPASFVLGVAIARGARYLALGLLAVYYGDAAAQLMQTHGRVVALGIVAMLGVVILAWWIVQRRAAGKAQRHAA
jgi:membrane protein YqaA with SNARE-associated domain